MRRLRIPGSLTLDDLHVCIQQAFGWDRHPPRRYLFSRDELRFLRLDPDLDVEDERVRDAEFTRVEDLKLQPGDRLRYLYDLIEHHLHEIVTEAVRSEPGRDSRPLCLGGEGPSPGDPDTPFDPLALNRSLATAFAALEPESI